MSDSEGGYTPPDTEEINDLLGILRGSAENAVGGLVAREGADRPGETPSAFTATSAGEPGLKTPLDPANVAVSGSMGTIYRLASAGTIAHRVPFALEKGTIEVLAQVRRATNPSDPAGHAVELRAVWLDHNKVEIGQTVLASVNDLTAANGMVALERIVYDVDGFVEAGRIAPPPLAVYMVPMLRTYGEQGAVDVGVIRAVQLTRATAISAPGVEFPDEFQWPEDTIPEVHASSVDAPNVIFPEDEPFTWPPETIPDDSTARVFYVSNDGSDTNNGESLRKSVRSIEKARDLAAATGEAAAALLYPGDYLTSGHIDMPDDCTVCGVAGQRTVNVLPTAGNEQRNVFRGGSGFMLRNVSGRGWRVDDFDDPREGFLLSFRPGAVIYRALYMDHCVNYRTERPVLIPPPLDPLNGNPAEQRGPGLALADASVASGYSPFAQIMIEASTNSSPNGIGCVVRGEAFLNAINGVMLWSHKHFMSIDGGYLLLNNCATQAGDYTLWSEGWRPEVVVQPSAGPLAPLPSDAARLSASRAALVAASLGARAGADPVLTERDTGIMVDALVYDLIAGSQESLLIFTRGLFPKGIFVSSNKAPFISSWNAMKGVIDGLSMTATGKAMAKGLIDALIATVQAPTFLRRPSKISANSHQFNLPFQGVNRRAFVRPDRDVLDTIIQRDLGTVQFSGTDERGKQFFTGGASVDPISGKLVGPPIARTISPFAIRAALIAGGHQ